MLDKLLPSDSAVLISGRAKISKKTYTVFAAGAALSGGHPLAAFRPTDTQGVRGLWLCLEGARKQTRRRIDWLYRAAQASIPSGMIRIGHRYPVILNDLKWATQIRDLVRGEDIKYVIIDTLAKAMTGDENSVQDVTDAMRSIDVIRSAGNGCSVLFLHHLRKPTESKGQPDIDDEMRGSSALAGFYDMHWALRESPGGGLIMVTRAKDEGELYYKMHWQISEGQQRAALSMEEFDPNAPPDNNVVLQCLHALEDGKVHSFSSLCEIWDLPAEAVKPIIDALFKSGSLERTPKGYRKVA